MHPPPRLLSPSPGGLEERWGRPPQEWVDRDKNGWDRCGGGGEESPGAGERGLEQSWGCLPHRPHQSYDTKTQNPCFHALPPPLPPPCKHGFAKRCPELCELLQWLAWGLEPPKKSLFPFPAHPTLPRMCPSPQDLGLQPRGLGLPPVILPQPNPYRPPWT